MVLHEPREPAQCGEAARLSKAGRKAHRAAEKQTRRQRDKALLKPLLARAGEHHRQGDLSAAIAALQRAVALAPARADLRMRLAQFHLRNRFTASGSPAEATAAVHCLRRAVALSPADPQAHALLADALIAAADACALAGDQGLANARLQQGIASYRDAL